MVEHKYIKKEHTFYQNDIVHNFNGFDYMVLEKLSEKNLILMNMATGGINVAVDAAMYVRYPKDEVPTKYNQSYGLEWGSGVYLGNTPSKIDFKKLRWEYGPTKQENVSVMAGGEREYQVEVKETLSRVETIRAETLGDAIDKAMDKYYSEEIVLDANDMKGVDFTPYEQNKRER